MAVLAQDYSKISVPKGFFSRGAINLEMVGEDSASWMILIERASDQETSWTCVTLLGLDNFRERSDSLIHSLVHTKLWNAMGRLEDLMTSGYSYKTEIGPRRYFGDASALMVKDRLKSEFSFLDPIVREEFSKLAETYGFTIVEATHG
jgi:hypothetical protein